MFSAASTACTASAAQRECRRKMSTAPQIHADVRACAKRARDVGSVGVAADGNRSAKTITQSARWRIPTARLIAGSRTASTMLEP